MNPETVKTPGNEHRVPIFASTYATLLGMVSFPVMAEHILANWGIQGLKGELIGLAILAIVNVYIRARVDQYKAKRLKNFYCIAIILMISNTIITGLSFVQVIIMH